MKQMVLVLSFSGAYSAQDWVPWLEAQGAAVVFRDASSIGGTGCYCDKEARGKIEALLAGELPRLRWVDSGDYHYMSYLLALREKEPFHLLLLDHHPDDQPPVFGEEVLSCGSWVKDLRDHCPQLRSVLSIGPEENREEGAVREEAEAPAEKRLKAWLEARRGERVYVSLDKDILERRWARTDWSQGTYSLERVKGLLRQVLESGMVLAAVDICGEMAPGKGATAEDLRINKETNMELFRIFNEQNINLFN